MDVTGRSCRSECSDDRNTPIIASHLEIVLAGRALPLEAPVQLRDFTVGECRTLTFERLGGWSDINGDVAWTTFNIEGANDATAVTLQRA